MRGPDSSEKPSTQDPRGTNPAAAPADAHVGPPTEPTSPPPDAQRSQPSLDPKADPQTRPRPVETVPTRERIPDAPTHRPAPVEHFPTLSRNDLTFVVVMLAAILLLSGIHLIRRYGWTATEIEVLPAADDYAFTIDINSATWVEWLQLDGIGEVLARRIVDYREQHGPFRSIDDLNQVRGIGDATLEKMRPYLTLEPADEELD